MGTHSYTRLRELSGGKGFAEFIGLFVLEQILGELLDAIARDETQGLDATLAHYHRAESVDGQWYVFIIDENDLVIAHPEGEWVESESHRVFVAEYDGHLFGSGWSRNE